MSLKIVKVEAWSVADNHKNIMLGQQTEFDHALLPTVGSVVILRHLSRRKTYRPSITKLVYDDRRDVYKLFLSFTHNHKYSTDYVCALLPLSGDGTYDHIRRIELEHWVNQLGA